MDTSLDTLLSHRRWVRSLAAALAQPADADDLEQEAWLAALERPPKGATPRAWLATVLRRAASNLRRTLARRAVREHAAARPEATTATADLVAKAEAHERVVRAVLALPEPYRSTILLRFFEGLSVPEIARRTGTAIDTVKTRLRRGLARLRVDLPEDRAWGAALIALAVPRQPLGVGVLAMSLKTKLAIVAATLLVAASAISYRVLDRPAMPARAPAEEARRPEVERQAPDPPSPGASAPEAPPLPVAEVHRDIRVTGVVTGAQDVSLYAVGEIDGKRGLLPLEDAHVLSDGSFSARIAFRGAETPWEIDVGACARGLVRAWNRIATEPGGTYDVRLVLERGARVAGVVLDRDGSPVPGLPLLAAGDMTDSLVTEYEIDTARRLVAGQHFAEGETDAAGRFEITGLPDGEEFWLVTPSETWILDHPERTCAPQDDLRVTAIHAHVLTGSIVDARTGALVSDASATVVLRAAPNWMCMKCGGPRAGRLRFVWKPQERELEGFEAVVTAHAEGYLDAEEVVSYPRGTRRGSVTLAMEPLDEKNMAVLLVDVVDTAGRAPAADIGITINPAEGDRVPPDRSSSGRPGAFEVKPLGSGMYEVRALRGPWKLVVGPVRRLGDIAWTGNVEIGRDQRVRCVLPRFGTVRVRWKAAQGFWIAHIGNDQVSRSIQLQKTETTFAVAPGDWKVWRNEGAPRLVQVTGGAETVVDFD